MLRLCGDETQKMEESIINVAYDVSLLSSLQRRRSLTRIGSMLHRNSSASGVKEVLSESEGPGALLPNRS